MSVYYSLILFFHVLSAALSIGPFFVLVPLIGKMRVAEESFMDEHISVFRSAVRIVKHAGHVLVATGVLLMWRGGYPWSTSWVVATIAVMFASIFFLARAFKPVLKNLSEGEGDRRELVGLLNRKLWTYIALLLVMLWFMVAKPNLW